MMTALNILLGVLAVVSGAVFAGFISTLDHKTRTVGETILVMGSCAFVSLALVIGGLVVLIKTICF